MACSYKRRIQIFQGLSQQERIAIVQIDDTSPPRAHPEIPPKIRLNLVVYRYIRQNTQTGVITVLPEGKRAAQVIRAES
jgi:hypothetical protein